MKTKMHMAKRVRSMKIGEQFMVFTHKERQAVCRVAKSLKDSGAIEFDVVTKRDGNKFKVAAI